MGMETNNLGNLGQGYPACVLGNAPSTEPTSAETSGSIPPGVSAIFSPWMIEHSNTVHRICSCMQARLDAGQRLEPVLRLFARRWNGKAFRSAPGRRIRLSRATLIRYLYLWRAGGRTPDSVKLKFRLPRISKQERSRRASGLLEASANTEVKTFAGAFARIHDVTAGLDAYCRCLTKEQRKILCEVFRRRREAASAERRLAHQVAETGGFPGK